MPYTIEDHKHRYAAWAASRAASTTTCRFTVLQCKNIIEAVGLNALLGYPSRLPSPAQIDAEHKKWREAAIVAVTKREGLTRFGHGVAAIKTQRFTLTAEMLLKAFSQRANRFKLGTFLSETGLFTKALSKRYYMTMAYSP